MLMESNGRSGLFNNWSLGSAFATERPSGQNTADSSFFLPYFLLVFVKPNLSTGFGERLNLTLRPLLARYGLVCAVFFKLLKLLAAAGVFRMLGGSRLLRYFDTEKESSAFTCSD